MCVVRISFPPTLFVKVQPMPRPRGANNPVSLPLAQPVTTPEHTTRGLSLNVICNLMTIYFSISGIVTSLRKLGRSCCIV